MREARRVQWPSHWQAERQSRRRIWGQPEGTGRFWPHGGVARRLLGL